MKKLFLSILPVVIGSTAVFALFCFLNGSVFAHEQAAPLQTVRVAATWGGPEQANFQAVLDEFTNQTGLSTTYEQITTTLADRLLNCAALDNCPDVAMVSPALINELAHQGSLLLLDPVVTGFNTNYSTTWRTLSSVDGSLFAVPFKVMSKSMIWYRPPALGAISATLPQTWAELLSLSDALVTGGQTPFAIGAISGGDTSGWPLSDWFENILLRVAGPEVHRKLVRHDISWTDPIVVEAMQRFQDIVGQEAYQAGGITGTLTTNFLDAIDLVFGSPPTATMYFEGGWVQTFIEDRHPGLTPGTDYNFFDFPLIDTNYGKPVMGAADFAVLFHDTPEAKSLIEFLATPQAAEIWAALGGGYLSPNRGLDPATYPDDLARAQYQQIITADEFVYDLDDQLPSELQRYFWNALMDFVAHQDQMMSILQGIEDKATDLQGPPYQLYLPVTVNP